MEIASGERPDVPDPAELYAQVQAHLDMLVLEAARHVRRRFPSGNPAWGHDPADFVHQALLNMLMGKVKIRRKPGETLLALLRRAILRDIDKWAKKKETRKTNAVDPCPDKDDHGDTKVFRLDHLEDRLSQGPTHDIEYGEDCQKIFRRLKDDPLACRIAKVILDGDGQNMVHGRHGMVAELSRKAGASTNEVRNAIKRLRRVLADLRPPLFGQAAT